MRNRNNGITLVALVVVLIVLIILTGVGIAIITSEVLNEPINGNDAEKQEYCQHEYVITSKWDWIRESYKTISKCSKCGKEVD